MKKSEILRIVRHCLIDDKSKSISDTRGEESLLDESDLHIATVQSLWGGMGHIYKVSWNSDTRTNCLILKHVAPPRKSMSLGDKRKADSYQVECNFYQHVAPLLAQKHGLSLPVPYLVERNCGKHENEMVVAMSYIHNDGGELQDDRSTLLAILTWLATLHAAFWGPAAADAVVAQAGLQACGSYWHLATRPDEHACMPHQGWEGRLKRAARAIDARLQRDPLQCIIHGDAKEANIMLSKANNNTASRTGEVVVTLCDFQYCGKGAPTKDLAYLFCTSSVNANGERAALEFYLQQLTQRLPDNVTPPTLEELCDSLELAYCDFVRFMAGWGYWGSGCQDRVKAVLQRLDGGKDLGSDDAYDQAVRREYG
jgi:serine/threonine protein kinase